MLTQEERLELLDKEYNIPIEDSIRKDVSVMCNLSQGIKEAGIAEGMEKGKAETSSAQIMLVSLVHKITNLITTLDFIQTEPVSDVVKPATYKVCFIDGKGQTISNEALVAADKRDSDSAKRLFRLRFTFRNQKYDRGEQYYLIAVDTASGLEAFRHQVTMDLAFADDFGFGL